MTELHVEAPGEAAGGEDRRGSGGGLELLDSRLKLRLRLRSEVMFEEERKWPTGSRPRGAWLGRMGTGELKLCTD